MTCAYGRVPRLNMHKSSGKCVCVCVYKWSECGDGGQRRVQVAGSRERECALGEGGLLVRLLVRLLMRLLMLMLMLVLVRVRAQRWRSASRPSRREIARASARAGGFYECEREGKCECA